MGATQHSLTTIINLVYFRFFCIQLDKQK